ncbi:VWA domain-containing protein [Salinimicrobium oceani]|uniref:VWA domain-containing protein n=1 Tax=Salinimicrobium oceani TaxID=2722702 RepID=A0ABX1D1J7_9FLAO|nr:VWA domain-containing protein [Salinimicrobium oceani]NJW53177.1 VWA domain-containing protein [Salinimicrobium oceani]
MPATTIVLIIAAFFLSLALAFFQYFYKAKGRRSQNVIFASLRFISFFALLVLVINPKTNRKTYFTEKPNLVLAVDNSSSITTFEAGDEVKEFVNKFENDKELKKKFEIQIFSFGKTVTQNDNLDFSETQTNLSRLFENLGSLYQEKIAPVILISDGNQTVGEDFTYSAQGFANPVIPVVVGDTARYQDLAINRVNANKYAFLNNRFPVEVMLSSSGNSSVETELKISKANAVVYSEKLLFSSEKRAAVVRAELPASSIGTHIYKVEITPLQGEKNLLNNTRQFAVEVIDERTKVLIAYSFLHPDLGALKRSIESNEQRQVSLLPITEVEGTDEFQLVILYQPDSRFSNLMSTLAASKKGYFLIAGPGTDWSFLNNAQQILTQEITRQSEEFIPVWNENFRAFQTEDLQFSRFPPLTGNFGNLEVSEELDVLLYRKIQGIDTKLPLLAVTETEASKKAFLMGADLWRWRNHVFQTEASFEKFDALIGKLIQFLSSGSRKERLLVHYQPLYQGNDGISIQAEYFDKSYLFDPRGSLEMVLTAKEGEQRQIPFLLKENSYEVDLSSLPPGEYAFTVRVKGDGLMRSGNFSIMDFNVEEQFASANLDGLQRIAREKDQDIFFPTGFEQLKNELLSDSSYAAVEKSRQKDVSLIDWKFLMLIIILSLSAEWFLRKYYGLI